MSCHLLCFASLFLGCHPDFPALFPVPDASPATNTALVFLLPVLIPLLVYYTRSTKYLPDNYTHTSNCSRTQTQSPHTSACHALMNQEPSWEALRRDEALVDAYIDAPWDVKL